ncbi:MAG: gliding motility-associated C-terminal domain-containing protein [Saprospiraceae bacterium]|nr:gliding motility-associated C-terminal domain-containing protein [Saprospiraceae bacterium]
MKYSSFLIICIVEVLLHQRLFAQCNFTVNAGPDIKVCNLGDMTNMAGKVSGSVKEIFWEPTVGLQDPKNPTTKITVNASGEYILVAKGVSGINLVTNGDFEQGKTAFSTDYIVGTISCYGFGVLDCEGTYDVINNPQLGHTGFAACKDHTSGGGLMMVLNGAASYQNVWCQSIPVMPNMDYIFTVWVTPVVAASPPILQLNINGSYVGPAFNASGSVCNWQKYEVIWNSGSNSLADICLLNQNTATGGNDFAIDDVSFVKICELRDTVLVEIEEINVVIEDPGIVNCDQPQLKIDATGSTQGKNFTFKWTTTNGKIISGDKTLTPTIEGPGTYELTICSPLPNCCKKAWIEVQGNIKKPDLSLTLTDSIGCQNDTAIIFTQSSVIPLEYFWEGPGGYVSDDQNAIVTKGGTYTVTVVDEYNCKTVKSINVYENADNPRISLTSNNINCVLDTAFLKCSSTVIGSTIEWFGPNGYYFKGDSIFTIDSGLYKVKVTTPNSCIKYDSVFIIRDQKVPTFKYTSDTINCIRDSSQISISSDLNLQSTIWNSTQNYFQISNLSIKTKFPGKYWFKGIAENGCADSILINVLADTNKPILNPLVDTINCIKRSIKLYSGRIDTNTVLNWIGPNGYTSNVDGDTVNVPGKYTVSVTSDNFCTASFDIEILIDTLHPKLYTSNDTLTCAKDKINLALIDSSNATYSWIGPNGFVSNLRNPVIDKQGKYIITAIFSNGCTSLDSIDILENKQKPVLTFKDDTLNCLRDSLQIFSTTNDSNSIYQWIGPNGFTSNLKNPFVKNAGSYWWIVTNSFGCTDSAKLVISQDVRRPDLVAIDDTLNCLKSTVLLRARSSRDSLDYFWTGPNGYSSMDSTIFVRQSGQYKIKVVTPEYCSTEIIVNVGSDTVKPIVSLLADTLNCKVIQFNLDPVIISKGIDQFSWIGPNGFNSQSRNPTINMPGNYRLTVTSSNFCSEVVSILVVQDTVKPIINLIGDTITCINRSIDLNASVIPANLTGEWILPDQSHIQGRNIQVTQPGNYSFSVVGRNFCSDTAEIFVHADTLTPDLSATGNVINCKNKSVAIAASSLTKNVTFQWMGPNLFLSDSSISFVSIPGKYFISARAANGCTSQREVIVDIDTISPKVQVNSDTIDCINSFVTVNSVIDVANPSILWRNSKMDSISNSFSFNTDLAGQYLVEVINPINYCKTALSFFVVEDSQRIKDLEIIPYNPICGNTQGRITTVKVIGGSGNYTYKVLSGKDSIPTQIGITNFIPGNYTLLVKDEKACEFRKDFTIESIPYIQTELVPQLSLKLGENAVIDLTIFGNRSLVKSIMWMPSTFLSCSDCEDPIVDATADIEYEVLVIDTNGCKSSQRIRIKVEEPEIWLPNVFSPNGDGINDWFYPYSSDNDHVEITTFQIFDRWGNLIFSNENIKPDQATMGWNGSTRSKKCNPGVYTYWLEAKLINGKEILLKGDITLMN